MSRRNRIILGVLFTTWIILSCVFTAQLKPTTTAEQFLDEDHPLQIGVNILSEEFSKTEDDLTTKVHFVWGLNDITRDGVNQLLDPEYFGVANFAEDFVFDETCQTAMLDACDYLRSEPSLEDFILRRNAIPSVDCFVEQLGTFNVNNDMQCPDIIEGSWENEAWQVSPSDLSTTMTAFVDEFTCGQDDLIKVQRYYRDVLGWDGENVRFVGISVESSVLDPNGVLSEEDTRVHYDKFVEVAKEFDKTMESACGTKTVMTDLDNKFTFMNNQRIFRTSAVTGSMFGVIVAFVVLFISTRKVHIAFFATLSILSVLLGVIGSITMIGWSLGTIEAILITILAGFSVDYVIHLAHAYHHASGDTESRIIHAFGDMGISVFSGMLTSVVASIPLFFCTLTFFKKFGTFLCLTIALSWIFANFFFMSLLATFKISMDRKWL